MDQNHLYYRYTKGQNERIIGLEPTASDLEGRRSTKWAKSAYYEPPVGIEPTTYALQVRRSTSWAKEAIAEAQGFEPRLQLPVKQFSRLPHSTALPSLRYFPQCQRTLNKNPDLFWRRSGFFRTKMNLSFLIAQILHRGYRSSCWRW